MNRDYDREYFEKEIKKLFRTLENVKYDIDSIVDDYYDIYGEEDRPFDESMGKLEDIANFLRKQGIN